MNPRRLLRLSALAALGLLTLHDAAALGLARARGAVFIGRPLNVAVSATLEPDDPETPCVEAEVFQGDSRVNASRVTTRWERGGAGSGTVRVTTDVTIDEPVVTLYLRVGCINKITRRYVMLAEQPPEGEQAVAPVRPATTLPVAPPRVAAPPAAAMATPPAVTSPAAPAGEMLRIRPAPRIDPARPRAKAERSRAVPPPSVVRRTDPRLKLEPLDLGPEQEPSLKTSGTLQSLPSGQDDEKRKQAAAMWRVLSAGPDEALRNSERIVALEREMKALQDLVARNTAAVDLMRQQTEKARGERNNVTLLAIVLGLLAVAGAGAAAWFWRSRREHQRAAWWGEVEMGQPGDSDFAEPAPAHSAAEAPAAPRAPKAPDIDITDLGALEQERTKRPARPPRAEPSPSRPASQPSSRWTNSDFQSSMLGGMSRNLKAEELIDIQQQADFFLSIGQPDRAIALLEAHLQQGDTSALAWLDLLEIYHDVGRREDYDRVRLAFQERFNAHVPTFEQYQHEEGAGLENYGRALSRIESLWPQPRVMEVIEESLLRKPETGDAEGFDLEAYRELVLLYNIAKEVSQHVPREPEPESDSKPGFMATQVQQLSALQPQDEPESQAMDDIDFEAPWERGDPAGLDIDLGDFSGDHQPTQPAPLPSAPAGTPAPTEPLMDLDSLDWRSLRR